MTAPAPSPLARVREALALYRSMVVCGEQETVESCHAMERAKNALESLTAHSEAVAALVEAAGLVEAALRGASDAGASVHYSVMRGWADNLASRLAALEDGA